MRDGTAGDTRVANNADVAAVWGGGSRWGSTLYCGAHRW